MTCEHLWDGRRLTNTTWGKLCIKCGVHMTKALLSESINQHSEHIVIYANDLSEFIQSEQYTAAADVFHQLKQYMEWLDNDVTEYGRLK